MSSVVFTKTLTPPPFCKKEILRYAGAKDDGGGISALLESCIDEAKDVLTYKVCYCELALSADGDICDFGVFSVRSRALAKNLDGCKSVLLFGATVGVGIDRLIVKYGRLSPSRALMLQAIGAERIEALSDAFCGEFEGLRPRFSAGYGDLPLECQKEIFAVLDCYKHIGLSLNGSMLMSPTKSVTAFAGRGDI